LDDFSKKELPEFTDHAEWIVKNMLFNLPVSSWNRMLKRDFLHRKEITFHEGIIHEDVPYCYQLALKCRDIGFVRKNTYLFRPQREGSITTTPQEERALKSRVIIMNDCMDAFVNCYMPNRTICNCFVRFLWCKWLTYMVIHSCGVLKNSEDDISKIFNRLCSITPWPMKVFAHIYSVLPIRLKHSKLFLKLLNLC